MNIKIHDTLTRGHTTYIKELEVTEEGNIKQIKQIGQVRLLNPWGTKLEQCGDDKLGDTIGGGQRKLLINKQ